MRTDVDEFEFGDFRFVVELDTGAETGADQRIVYYAEQLDAASLPLASFSFQQLLDALCEPEKTRVVQQWEQARGAIEQQSNQTREEVRSPFRNARGRIEQMPGKAQQQLGALRQQEKAAYQQLERQLRAQILQLDRQQFDMRKFSRKKRFCEPRYVRDFYFDEANSRYIENFCRKFASDTAYREEVLSGRAHWVERNALFVRNLRRHCASEPARQTYEECARAFFKWISTHAQAILQLPEYQQLQARDNRFIAQRNQIDPEIREAVALLNQLPGTRTNYSCQGVSGTVTFQGYSLLVVSEHEEHAYVSFETLGENARLRITRVLPDFPDVELLGPLGRPFWQLRATGGNPGFRAALLALVRKLDEGDRSSVQEHI